MAAVVETLKLPARLDLKAAPDLYDSVAALPEKPVQFDASAVTYIGANCVQVLLAAAGKWGEKSLSYRFKSPSDAFTDGLDKLGLSLDKLELGVTTK